ncbi:MAG: hypothetical protein K2Y05_04330 [Hyphomicrobiaceae bacterium]|nr:hypothetical protein [Hyphomicrobiaceae bacterium]
MQKFLCPNQYFVSASSSPDIRGTIGGDFHAADAEFMSVTGNAAAVGMK